MKTGIAAIVLVVAGLLAGCGAPHRGDAARDADGGSPLVVDVFTVGGDATAGAAGTLVLPGRVEARSAVTLEARLAGRVTRLPLREGAAFRAGATLAEFDAPEAATAVRASRARLAAAVTADERAARQEARLDSLHARGVVALRDLELGQSAARAAAAERAAAAADVERWTSGTRLVAPFAGVVVRRRVDPGADVAAGQAVLDLRSREAGDVVSDVPESALDGLAGARFELSVADGPWRAADLVRVEGMIDPASRSRRAWLRLRPGEGPTPEPGAFVRVRIRDGAARGPARDGRDADSTPRAITVPSRSLVRRGGLSGVYVVLDDRARLRWVRLGRAEGSGVEVAAGLADGDRVLLDPAGVTDGRRVSPRP